MEQFATGQQAEESATRKPCTTGGCRSSCAWASPGTLAEVYADRIDWHQIARLVRGGCPARLALRIVV